MLKVYVAAIAASHAPVVDQLVGRSKLVVRFLKGSMRLNPPRPFTTPTPFESLQSVNLQSLSLKTGQVDGLFAGALCEPFLHSVWA